MSGIAARGRRFDLLAMLVIGLVIVAAALLPAVTANSGGTTTVRGDVTLNGKPLAFFPVGFWTESDGATGASKVVKQTLTDGSGGFTLEVSDTIDGFAYAGTTPDSDHAVLEHDGLEVVRGVLTSTAASDPAYPLYQGRTTSTAKALAGGASQVHFELQEAGRITGVSPVAASGLRSIEVRRADNSVVQTLHPDAKSRFRSMLLAPGQYGVVLVPKSPGLPTVADAVVRSGATTSVSLSKPTTGATVLGTVRTPAGAVGSGVPVLLEQEGEVLAATTTSSSGDWSFAGVAAGDYAVEVGRFDEPASSSASLRATDVRIPGASPSPTPTASTASPTPSTTATTPQGAAVEPVDRTSDAVLPQSFSVTVPAVLGEVSVGTQVEQAGRLTGQVTVSSGTGGPAGVQVVVEEASTERVVRVATTGEDGRYAVGGLQPGTRYRVYAVTRPSDSTLAQLGGTTAVARAKAATADVLVDRAALTLSGTVASTTSGTVTLGDSTLLQRTGTIDQSGAYTLQGLVPGAYPVVVTAPKRAASEAVGVVVSGAQTSLDLQPGPQPAAFTGWFIATGAGVPTITGTASDADGDTVRFGPTTNGGHVSLTGLTPGAYTYDPDSFRGSAPTVDGPWYYQPPTGGFTLTGGMTTGAGPIVLHVRTH